MIKISTETITKFRDKEIIQRNDYQNFTLDSVLLGDFVKINRKIKRSLTLELGVEFYLLFYMKNQNQILLG